MINFCDSLFNFGLVVSLKFNIVKMGVFIVYSK